MNKNIEKSKNTFIRPENLAQAIFGVERVFDNEEMEMKKLLIEEYRKDGRNLLGEVRKWRAEHGEEVPLGKVIRALYEIEEEKKL